MLEQAVINRTQATFGVTQVLTLSHISIMHLILLHLAKEICSNHIITLSNIQIQLQRLRMDILKGLVHVKIQELAVCSIICHTWESMIRSHIIRKIGGGILQRMGWQQLGCSG